MKTHLVLCGGLSPGRGDKQALQLDTNPNALADRRVELRLEALTKQLVDDLDPILRDAVEIAAYVLMADRLIRRESSTMPNMGASWRRRLKFRIPVRSYDIWTAPEVLDSLVSTLSFLSEDEISMEFQPADPAAILDPYLHFADQAAQRIQPDDIILFSGGLDSLAGVVDQVLRQKRKAVLVTHKSSTNVAHRQDSLAATLTQKAPGQLFYSPVWVRKGDYEPVEHTQRTRSFLFVSLGIAVAQMFGRDQVEFFENGITSFNLPISEHVIGTRASRTTHPKVLASFSRLFSLLLQRTVSIENKFIWHTKADVVEILRSHGCADLIGSATSCAHVRNLSMTLQQCGVCSQCIERRYAVLSAGVEANDAPQGYKTDLFLGAHSSPQDITLAEQHLSRANRLSQMSKHAFLAAYGQVFRAVSALPGGSSQNAESVFELHRRYGRGIMAVVDRQMIQNAGLEHTLELEPTSLLSMIRSATGLEVKDLDPTETEPIASVQAAADPSPTKKRIFMFAVDEEGKEIVFADGPVLSRASFKLVSRLLETFREDTASGKPKRDFRYVPTATLMSDLKIAEHTLAQRALRIRKSLREQFLMFSDYPIDDHDVIQSIKWKGYRLCPYLFWVPLADLKQGNVITPAGNVMTRAADLRNTAKSETKMS